MWMRACRSERGCSSCVSSPVTISTFLTYETSAFGGTDSRWFRNQHDFAAWSRCWHTSCLDLGNKVGVSETPTALGIGQNKLAKTNVNRTQAVSGENNNSFHIKPHFYESSSFQAGLNRTSVFTSWDEPLAVLMSLGVLPWTTAGQDFIP